ncbi:Fanconi anemia group M protein isoform X1 [Ochotona curzoniae]|uniref:Fanconi anemia group M protein isoform X1 n=1 Tax=Ochotona curzoniae TaxID=130825 RepID=UPI001B34E94D|nr:Fanconi anemia group M protein isoform X1 [Ochotona curzoniae]
MSGRQRTLLQAWGCSVTRAASAGTPGASTGTERPPSAAAAQPDSDDDVLLVAACEAEQQLRLENGGFCSSAGALWIYPTNCPVRDYQLRISQTALLCNTLVCLPTGLGKTFIAAVVMYNFYRWFPSGKVVFMAPTKPLVTQQIEACYRVMGIPQSHMAEMTGSTAVCTRKEVWSKKRVLFLTPQVMVNDLSRGTCPAAEVKCLVIDEAHKALGNYAYCQVVRELVKYTNHFRILALSATPGGDIKAVQQVITNLLIGQIEIRSEDSPDILPYSHERRVEKVVVPLGEELAAIQKTYIQILEAFASSLIQKNVLMRRDIPNLTKYQIILARDQFRKNPSPNIVGIQQGVIEGEFALCISLYHGYELLQQMGMRSLYFFFCGIMDGSKGMTRAKNELSRNEDFMKLYSHLENKFAHTRSTSAGGNSAIPKGAMDKSFFYGHPKLKKLEEVVVKHFTSWNAQNTSEKKCEETRVMIFSSFRDSVQEIAEMLSQHRPVIRVMTFVGHASGKSTKGFTQKEQLEVVKQFRDGGYNTLVSTCVGEEGLDIGEVDLIICFDAQKSPIRLVQRMGRTGRKRQGRIVVILAEGREERTYNQSQSNKRSIYKAISGNRQVLHFYQKSPRMVPDGINPELHKMFITHDDYESERPSRTMQRKSSVFSKKDGIKQNNSKKDWFLSEEEFKLWDSLYRLRDSDKIKEIRLPQVQFLSLQNEENRPVEEPTPGVHHLSLSDWGVWQDHPFPTFLVDHSDRCHHFVNIMQMIEQLRHEEGECSYELDIKSHLHMEDVSSASRTSRKEYTNFASDTFTTHKKSTFTKSINKDSALPATESAEEYADIFKQTCNKLTKSCLRKNAPKETEKDEPDKEDDVVMDSLATDRNSVEKNVQLDLGNDKKTAATEEMVTTYTSNENVVNQLCDSLTDGQLMNKSPGSLAINALDSGYNSFNDEKSIPSNLILPFEEEFCITSIDDQFYNNQSLTKQIVANVEKFLSHSPPPVSSLSDLECEISKEFALETSALPYGEHVQTDESICLKSQSTVNSQQNLDLDSHKFCNPGKNNLYGTTNDKVSDVPRLYDCDDKVNKDSQDESSLPSNHGQILVEPAKNLVTENNLDIENNDISVSFTIHDESLLLFEDVDDEFNDVNYSPLKSKCKSICSSDKAAVSEMAPMSQFLISDELLLDNDSEPQDQIISNTNSRKSHEDLRAAQEEAVKRNEDAFDCSRDLFSVTFDLGFCSSDSDDGISEHESATNNNRLLEVSGSCIYGRERSNATYVSHQSIGYVENFTTGFIPFPPNEDVQNTNFKPFPLGAAGNKEFLAPGFSRFSSPVGKKVMSTPLSESSTLNSFSKIRKEMQDSNKVNFQNFEETLNSTLDDLEFSLEKAKSTDQICLHQSCHSTKDGRLSASNESEDDVFIRKSKRPKINVLKSPEDPKSHEGDSPLHAVRKRRAPVTRLEFSSSDESENSHEPHSRWEDFVDCNRKTSRGVKIKTKRRNLKRIARTFLDDEAELSEEDAQYVSSDENDESENEQDSSLRDFINDEIQPSQAVNDSEMRGVYMKSLQSPLLSNKYKMVHKKHNNINIFSQIPEQDETYLEDSFCVGEEESCKSESSVEETCVDFNLVTEDCCDSGSKKYKTRRAVMLKQMREKQGLAGSKKKLSRIILPDDSSEEEDTVKDSKDSAVVVNKNKPEEPCWKSAPCASPLKPKERQKAAVSQAWDQRPAAALSLRGPPSQVGSSPEKHNQTASASSLLTTPESGKDRTKSPVQLQAHSVLEDSRTSSTYCSSSRPCLTGTYTPLGLQQEREKTYILVDSREISSGLGVISSLRAAQGLQVEVCPLNGCDYIVSNRMVVERKSQSEMLNSINKNKLIEQIQHLQSMFERICVIVEKDREKTGDTSRMFRRTKTYDSLLTSLTGAGIRILFSSCQEETAELLKELSLLEQRKHVGIHDPAVVKSSQCEALQFYLSIPNISYITALNMCHQFSTVRKMVNSSPQEISMCAQVTHQKAEEIYTYIHYVFDTQMLPSGVKQDTKI